MSKNPLANNIQRNLRTLLTNFESVAHCCRQIGVNRQQFNKYLAGTHAPSRRTLRKFADHFGLTEDDLLLGKQHFAIALEKRDSNAEKNHQNVGHFDQLLAFAESSVASLKPFLGTYDRYHYSTLYPGKLVRAVTILYQAGSVVKCLTVERFPSTNEDGKAEHSFFFSGICYFMGNRIFVLEYERRQKNEMTSAILMPQFRTPVKHIFGLVSGIVASTFRPPFSTRVVYERLSDDQAIRKGKLRRATLVNPNDAEISSTVARYFAENPHQALISSE